MCYTDGDVPADYKCHNCGVLVLKLWRESATFTIRLLCALCAGRLQHVNIDDIDADGKHKGDRGHRTDNIGVYVSAVPDEDNIGYYWYSSVPTDGVNWWKKLPTKL